MSSEVNIRESPNHFIVLDAISRGMSNIGKISKVSKLSKTEIELIVNDLIIQRLITSNEKRGFLGRKKIELKITETGMNLLGNKKKELQDKVKEMQKYYDNGNRTQLESLMDSNRGWMPMMLFSGVMNILFFTSMMSLMGLAMSPMESSLAGSGEGGSADSGSATAGDSSSDSSGADTQAGTDTGGFDGGGFDGGGFDF
ncbi:MAG TPA: MarR family transcriptional regulator [Nitrososphaeraceae archaeon]|nr:MarR family transcriptional regulator [Nitrososphaeraceae archaeon]